MTPRLHLEAVGDAAELTATNLLRALRPGLAGDHYVDVNLRHLRWIEPAGLVLIAALAQSQNSIGRQVRLKAPADTNLRNFLSRMHLGEVIEQNGGEHNLPTVNEEPLANSLLELQAFSGPQGGDQLAALVRHRLSSNQGLARAMYSGVAEIGENVHLHADTDRGYAAAVYYPTKNRLMFAIADAGEGGLMSTLGPKGFNSETEIIETLFDSGTSRFDAPGAGRGVRSTRDLVMGQRGRILMASGTTAIEDNNLKRIHLAGELAIPGTLLQANLPTRGAGNLDIQRFVDP